jgi:hypothetical protein
LSAETLLALREVFPFHKVERGDSLPKQSLNTIAAGNWQMNLAEARRIVASVAANATIVSDFITTDLISRKSANAGDDHGDEVPLTKTPIRSVQWGGLHHSTRISKKHEGRKSEPDPTIGRR